MRDSRSAAISSGVSRLPVSSHSLITPTLPEIIKFEKYLKSIAGLNERFSYIGRKHLVSICCFTRSVNTASPFLLSRHLESSLFSSSSSSMAFNMLLSLSTGDSLSQPSIISLSLSNISFWSCSTISYTSR